MRNDDVKLKVRLSEIQILPVKPRDGLVAFVSFVLDESYYVADVAIYSRLDQDGYRLVYPMRTLANGARVNAFHPIRKDVAQEIERQVSEAYRELLQKVEKGREQEGKASD